MILTPIYSCRNCRKIYAGAKQEVPNVSLEKLVPAARFTLGSQDHVFRLGGKTFQLSDLHQCNDHEVGLANFLRLEVDDQQQASKTTTHPEGD